YMIQGSKGRAKVVAPTQAEGHRWADDTTVSDISFLSRVTYLGQECTTADSNHHSIKSIRIGLIASPTTDQEELMSSMQDSVNNSTFTNLLADLLDQIVVIVLEITGTEVRALICSGSRLRTTDPAHISCTYTIASALITNPRPIYLDILLRQPGNTTSPAIPKSQAIFSFYYLPMVSTDEPPFAILNILIVSTVTAAYFASLGPNLILDWKRSTLYVAYDTVDIIKGYEVPR
ncbi:hypothetical protein BG015_009420, partial [Linnemannia schmuckeri]